MVTCVRYVELVLFCMYVVANMSTCLSNISEEMVPKFLDEGIPFGGSIGRWSWN